MTLGVLSKLSPAVFCLAPVLVALVERLAVRLTDSTRLWVETALSVLLSGLPLDATVVYCLAAPEPTHFPFISKSLDPSAALSGLWVVFAIRFVLVLVFIYAIKMAIEAQDQPAQHWTQRLRCPVMTVLCWVIALGMIWLPYGVPTLLLAGN